MEVPFDQSSTRLAFLDGTQVWHARESPGYAEMREKKIVDAKHFSGNRYEAVNLANPDTVELRIFKGTLKYTSFMKNLEFVSATIRFCRATGINQLDVSSFLDWFKPVRKDYPNLDAWLVRRHYIPSRSKPNKKAGA